VLTGAREVAHVGSNALGNGLFGHMVHVIVGCLRAHGSSVECVLQEHSLTRSERVLFSNVDIPSRVILRSRARQEFVDCQAAITIDIVFVEETS